MRGAGYVLGLAELVDHEVAGPFFDDFLDLGALMPLKDYETVSLRVNAVIVRDRQADQALTSLPSALAENLDQLVRSGASLLIGPFDLAVGRPEHRLVLGDPLVSFVHGRPSLRPKRRTRLAGIEPATSRSGGARSIP